jgi:crotonobetainyl-CoA:carnitine CoA-transferase CaiB-like acyl-CoA transferase
MTRETASKQGPRGPLDGLRAIVLTQAWAGTFATELLGLMGAEVIQIEARQRLDSWRGGYGGKIPAALRDRPEAAHPWNCSPLYNSVNLNKQNVTLNLGHPEGLAIFKRLVPFADIMAENFTPRVMGNLGLDYASLTKLRPDLIMLSMSAYGATGPYANVPGIGGTIEPMAGMSALLGYEDGPPLNSGQMYPDPVAGYFGAAAVLVALHYRERTGKGQYIDLSMQEANMTFIADALMDYSANRRVRGRLGNRHPTIAPHNIYPTRGPGVGGQGPAGSAAHADPRPPTPNPGGEDAWIAIAAETDEEFRRLCTVAGHPEWAGDSRFADAAARKRNEAALDALIAAWTGTRDAFALEAELCAAGVPAGVVRDGAEVLATDHLRERGMVVPVAHPEAGTHLQAGAPWRLSRTPGGVTRPAPMLGEHSREVLARFLGIDDAEYARLESLGVTGTGPPD